jgi:Zn-dependent M32 family carboxypeptidase
VTRRRPGRLIPFPGRRGAADAEGLVEVHRCDQSEALVVKSLFESERIPTLLRSRLAHSVHPFTVGAQGEIRILVPQAEVEHARRLLGRLNEPG